ncbi:hypothetical protein ACLKA7_014510 [Drosophila subpalustris]
MDLARTLAAVIANKLASWRAEELRSCGAFKAMPSLPSTLCSTDRTEASSRGSSSSSSSSWSSYWRLGDWATEDCHPMDLVRVE